MYLSTQQFMWSTLQKSKSRALCMQWVFNVIVNKMHFLFQYRYLMSTFIFLSWSAFFIPHVIFSLKVMIAEFELFSKYWVEGNWFCGDGVATLYMHALLYKRRTCICTCKIRKESKSLNFVWKKTTQYNLYFSASLKNVQTLI